MGYTVLGEHIVGTDAATAIYELAHKLSESKKIPLGVAVEIVKAAILAEHYGVDVITAKH